MDNINEKLNEAIERHLDEISSLDVGSDEMKRAIDETVKLHKLRMDELTLKSEENSNVLKLNFDERKATVDNLNYNEELNEKKKDRYFRVGIAAAEIILPLTVYSVLAYLGFAREFDGVITSDTLKRVLNNVKPKR